MTDKKTPTAENSSFNDIFSDSEDENEVIIDKMDEMIIANFQSKFVPEVRMLDEFLKTPEFITPKGDRRTNIVNLNHKDDEPSTFCIPDNKISKMFKMLDICRRKRATLRLYEKQLEYSGIMLDFDICQTSSKSHLAVDSYHLISHTFMRLIKKYVDLDHPDIPHEGPDLSTYCAIIRKPEVKYNEDKKYYKDGFHLLMPDIKIKREVKKFLIKKIKEEEIFRTAFSMIEPAKIKDDPFYSYLDFVDINSAHVPVFFLGCSSKKDATPYILDSVSVIKTSVKDLSNPEFTRIAVCPEFNANDMTSPIVLVHELSLNWQTEKKDKNNSLIKKRQYEIKEQYAAEVNFLITDNCEEDKILEEEYGELSLLSMHDPNAEYIKELLDTLDPFRYTDFDAWFRVLCVLAHTNKSYRTLAEYFSKKSIDKYNPISFEHHWQSATVNKKNKLNIGSLHYWAKLDNPIKYEEVRQLSIYSILCNKVYDNQLDGNLQHYDIAKLLHISLQHKYIYDNSNGGTWYEFILEEDPHRPGEIYKWRLYNRGGAPNSIKKYMSEILPKLFDKVLNKITKNVEDSNDLLAKYHNMIKTNFKNSCRKLRDNGFKSGVARECEQIFEKINFSEVLDKDPEIMGVGNGILKLGEEIQFIDGYHNYPVSQYTKVNYIPFDPFNPTTKKVLIVLREIFPDDEPDTFEFLMHYLASALDAKKKESLLLMLVGGGSNGKSFLTELMKETIGNMYAVKMAVSFLTSRPKSSETATPALMALINARFAYYSETEQSEVLHLAKVKELTGQETLSGRKLFGDFITFKPTCNHMLTSNYDISINGNDHGTWRRMKRIDMKIRFYNPAVDTFNPNNPNDRIKDPTIGASWPENPEVQSSFLSILCYYYKSLQKKYKGIVENVPHQNIKRDTEKFRDRQDKINNFINIRIVKTVDPDHQITMANIIESYTKWYDSLYPDEKDYKKSLASQFENSKLGKVFEKTKTGTLLKGYRILDAGAEPEEGELFFMDIFMDKKLSSFETASETSAEFYARICAEYKLDQIELAKQNKKYAEEVHLKNMQKIKNMPVTKIKPVQKQNNVEINEKEYDLAGFKKNNISGLSMDDIREIAGSDSDQSESDSDSN